MPPPIAKNNKLRIASLRIKPALRSCNKLKLRPCCAKRSSESEAKLNNEGPSKMSNNNNMANAPNEYKNGFLHQQILAFSN